MELYDENQEIKKKSKMPKIIGISIFILLIMTILIIYLIFYLKSTITTISLNGKINNELEEVLFIDEENSQIYIPIRKIAEYFDYEAYRGDYKNKSEDQSKCYAKSKNEIVQFTLNSNTITKTEGDLDYQYVEIDQNVFEKDGELYTTKDGIEKAFNVQIYYEPKKRNIDIYTMEYLVEYYAYNRGIEKYSDDFTDQKAIFENMIIVENNGQYGVIDITTNKAVLETKYEAISYLPNTKEFLVKSNGKYGIVSKEAEIKVKIAYDKIKIMDNQNGLYIIMQNDLYGVINTEGKIIIKPEYQQIGIDDIDDFEQNGVESQYILLNELIPIKNNNLWGFFDLQGNQISDFQYTGLGCKSSNVASSYPTLVIPSYKIIVVKENGFYNLMSTKGKEIVPKNVLDSVYMKMNTQTGETSFFMTYNGQTKNIEEELEAQGVK